MSIYVTVSVISTSHIIDYALDTLRSVLTLLTVKCALAEYTPDGHSRCNYDLQTNISELFSHSVWIRQQ